MASEFFDRNSCTFSQQALDALLMDVVLLPRANDCDEWELELLGERWAYVTVCLIGRENCPDVRSQLSFSNYQSSDLIFGI